MLVVDWAVCTKYESFLHTVHNFWFSVSTGWGLQFLLCVVHGSCVSTSPFHGLQRDAWRTLLWPRSTVGLNDQPCGGAGREECQVSFECVPLSCVWEGCFLSVHICCLSSQHIQPKHFLQVCTPYNTVNVTGKTPNKCIKILLVTHLRHCKSN